MDIQEMVDELNRFKSTEKVLFASANAHDGKRKRIFITLHGNFEVHHGDEKVDEGMQPYQIVKTYMEL